MVSRSVDIWDKHMQYDASFQYEKKLLENEGMKMLRGPARGRCRRVVIDNKNMEISFWSINDQEKMTFPFRGWCHSADFKKKFTTDQINFMKEYAKDGVDCLSDLSKLLKKCEMQFC